MINRLVLVLVVFTMVFSAGCDQTPASTPTNTSSGSALTNPETKIIPSSVPPPRASQMAQAATSTKSPTEPLIRKYSKLEITLASYSNGQIDIVGETDLPDGADLFMEFQVVGDDSSYISFGVPVQNGKFSTKLKLASLGPVYEKGPYSIKVEFNSFHQKDQITTLVGEKGENIEGDKVSSLGYKILEDSRIIEGPSEPSPLWWTVRKASSTLSTRV